LNASSAAPKTLIGNSQGNSSSVSVVDSFILLTNNCRNVSVQLTTLLYLI
jgi:hypothetical protein